MLSGAVVVNQGSYIQKESQIFLKYREEDGVDYIQNTTA